MDSECFSCFLTVLVDIFQLSLNGIVIFVAVADPGSFNNSVAGQQVGFNH